MVNAPTIERQRRTFVPDEAWLAKQAQEPIIEPDLPIVDPHHHLWDHLNSRYLLDELLADTGSGHTITATVWPFSPAYFAGTVVGGTSLPAKSTTFVLASIPSRPRNSARACAVARAANQSASTQWGEKNSRDAGYP